MSKFIVLEGIDGTGKTSVAGMLFKLLEKTAMTKTPPIELQPMVTVYDDIADLNARYLFFISGVIVVSKKIEKLLKYCNVVCDRYIYTTLAYHKAMGVNVDMIDIDKLPILKPDLSICLTAKDFDVLIERIAARDGEKYADKFRKNIDFYKKVDKNFRQLIDKSIFTDESNVVLDVTNKVLELISEL